MFISFPQYHLPLNCCPTCELLHSHKCSYSDPGSHSAIAGCFVSASSSPCFLFLSVPQMKAAEWPGLGWQKLDVEAMNWISPGRCRQSRGPGADSLCSPALQKGLLELLKQLSLYFPSSLVCCLGWFEQGIKSLSCGQPQRSKHAYGGKRIYQYWMSFRDLGPLLYCWGRMTGGGWARRGGNRKKTAGVGVGWDTRWRDW